MKSLLSYKKHQRVHVAGFDDGLEPDLKAHLLAWGLTEGVELEILAQSPVTRVLIEQTELALEPVVAKTIFATPL